MNETSNMSPERGRVKMDPAQADGKRHRVMVAVSGNFQGYWRLKQKIIYSKTNRQSRL